MPKQTEFVTHQVLALSETFGRADQPPLLDPIPGFKMWSSERGGAEKGGGGLTMIYNETLTAHQWTPPVPPNQQYVMGERQWLLLENGHEKCAFLHVYIACQTTRNDSYVQWNEDLFSLLTQEAILLRRQGFTCMAMGDFNTRVGAIPGLEGNTQDTNHNYPMFMNFITEVNMTIINTLPVSRGLFTRFMDTSGRPGTKSLLDYGLIDNDHVNTVTSFVIDEEARFAAGSDHALLECTLEFGARPKVTWAFTEAIHYNITGATNYTEYQATLDTAVSSVPLNAFTNLPAEEMLPHISESINQSAMKTLGIKVKKTKPGRKLPPKVISLIRDKNAVARSVDSARLTSSSEQVELLEQQLASLKADVSDALAGVKLQRRHHLRARVLRADPSRRKFWRFLKSQINTAGSITAAYNKTGSMVFDQTEIEEAVLDHFEKIFVGQRVPVFPSSSAPSNQVELALSEMEQILNKDTPSFVPTMFEEQVCTPYSFTEMEEELDQLADGKASGYDKIPNELLKNTGFKFKLYLQTFLNKVMEDGKVAQDLNIGKCMLIYKVG